MKIYIAGKISGLKDGEAYRNFRIAEANIREAGHYPINPMKLVWMYPDFSYEDYMRVDQAMIDCADGVLFLDNWVESPGAKRELVYAVKRGKQIYAECEMLQTLHPKKENAAVR